MDFSLSEEQQLLKDSVQRFVREEYELDIRRKLVDSELGYSDENWKKMAELGWLALAGVVNPRLSDFCNVFMTLKEGSLK